MADFDFTSIGRLIKNKELEITRRTNTGLHDNSNLKKLRAILQTYKDKRPFNGFISILIKPEEIENLIEDCSTPIFDVIDKCIAKAHNHVMMDRACAILSTEFKHYNNTNEARRIYADLSKEYCVFVVKQADIHYFLNGEDVGEIIFFTKEEEEKYKELKGIQQIHELFDEYKIHLTIRNTYQKFFVSNSGKSALYKLLINDGIIPKPIAGREKKDESNFLNIHQQLLQNKPEDRFREDLRKFLDGNFRGTVETTKEHLLENFQRIDILITGDFGDKYLIEVKWVGTSIHADGNKVGTSFDETDINPEAIIQTVKYLIELHKHQKHIKLGYLVVFDARVSAVTDTVAAFDTTELTAEQNTHYNRFIKIKDFRVINEHPN